MTPKQPWSLDRWKAFGERCQALNARVNILPDVVSGTPRIKAGTLDDVIAIRLRLVAAIESAAQVMTRQHGGHGDLPSFLQGPIGITGEKIAVLLEICRPSPVPSGNVPCMTREQWAAFGREIKAIDVEAGALSREIRGTTKVSPFHAGRFSAVLRAIEMAKVKLSGLAYVQHPDWPDFMDVFYGKDVAQPPAQSAGDPTP